MSYRGEMYNASGYFDPTAFEAINRVAMEEHRYRRPIISKPVAPQKKVYMCIYIKRERKED